MAQWAQLKGGPPEPYGLQRGHWYGVVDVMTTGMVRVSGPSAIGTPLHLPAVRIIDREPDMITRIEGTGFRAKTSSQVPQMSFYGVCPKGHRVELLSIADDTGRCDACGVTYPIEDEEQF